MLLNRERAQEMMEARGVEALVATSAENVYYLSGYGSEHLFHFSLGGFSAAVLPCDPEKPPTLLVQEWELPHLISEPTWMPDVRVLTGFDVNAPEGAELGADEMRLVAEIKKGRPRGGGNRQRLLAQVLDELGLGSSELAFDEMTAFDDLKSQEHPDLKMKEGPNFFREIRNIKTADEIALLRRAARLNQNALESVVCLIDVGITPGELMRHYRGSMALQGGYGSHMTGGGGRHPWLSHGDFSYRFKDGDVIYLDPAGHYRHYWADMGRAVIVGKKTEKFEHIYGTLVECHRELVPQIRDGASSSAILAESRRKVADVMPRGFVPLMHSIGIEQYDHPQSLGCFLSEDFTLAEGMVVNYETLYFELGWGLVQLEDTYLVGRGQPERFQTMSQEAVGCPVK